MCDDVLWLNPSESLETGKIRINTETETKQKKETQTQDDQCTDKFLLNISDCL